MFTINVEEQRYSIMFDIIFLFLYRTYNRVQIHLIYLSLARVDVDGLKSHHWTTTR